MILIADSGSTKTDWTLSDNGKIVWNCKTGGINPYHQTQKEINDIINNELFSKLSENNNLSVTELFYYGAGCATAKRCSVILDILSTYFENTPILVESDMLGTARALCQHNEGIACVLGTGSNSCLFDGEIIIDQIPPLGYILGDEGSGAFLGKKLLVACLKRELPELLCSEFMTKYELTLEIVLDNVYNKPLANRFMAGFTHFLVEHREIPEIKNLLKNSFTEFFRRNVMAYNRPWIPVHFTGSIAKIFQSDLKQSANSLGIKTGTILQSPMEGLVKYHS
ncbi:MAG TPA: ATPase [Bacteroidaceae bacterium]|nr:ATPase [Bacteroidaceae bacterium]